MQNLQSKWWVCLFYIQQLLTFFRKSWSLPSMIISLLGLLYVNAIYISHTHLTKVLRWFSTDHRIPSRYALNDNSKWYNHRIRLTWPSLVYAIRSTHIYRGTCAGSAFPIKYTSSDTSYLQAYTRNASIIVNNVLVVLYLFWICIILFTGFQMVGKLLQILLQYFGLK